MFGDCCSVGNYGVGCVDNLYNDNNDEFVDSCVYLKQYYVDQAHMSHVCSLYGKFGPYGWSVAY